MPNITTDVPQNTNKIKLTAKNLIRYGDIVFIREWMSPQGVVAEKYIVWFTDKMLGKEGIEINPNRNKMYRLTMLNGDVITMREV